VLRAAIILIYSGMDMMASLDIPAGKLSVERSDFVAWVDRYIRFPCRDQLRPIDLYGARCSVLHTYSVDSDLSRAGACRRVGYMDNAVPEVAYNPVVAAALVLVSVQGLKDAFFKGIDNFLVRAFADPEKAPVVESHLKALLHELPFSPPPEGATT
jgi:hypothetical protein